MSLARLSVPKTVRKGEIFAVRTLINHVMETGNRRDAAGKRIPRQIVHSFTCSYNGKVVFESTWHSAVSANPYLSFDLKAAESGTIEVTWADDDGKIYKERSSIQVT